MPSGKSPRHRIAKQRNCGRFLCAAALLVAHVATADAAAFADVAVGPAPRFFAQIDLFVDAGPVTIDAALHDWFGPLAGGSHQTADNRISLGVDWRTKQAAFFYRYAESLDFSRDTAVLFHQQRNGGALLPGSSYQLALDAKRFSALGLSWRQSLWHGTRGELAASLSAFRAADLLDGSIRGQATVIDADSFSYNAQVDYRYDEDTLFDRPVRAPDGYGAAVGIDGNFTLTPRATLSFRIDDLGNAIRWQDVPTTTATASSSRTWTDKSGNPVIGPALSGNEYYLGSWSQRIAPTGNIALTGFLNDRTSVTAQFDVHLVGHDGSLALTHRFASVLVSGAFYPSSRGLGLSVSLPQVRVAFAGSALSEGDAHWQHLQLDLNEPRTVRHFDER